MKKAKEVLSALLVIIVIVFLGLTPVTPTGTFSIRWGDLGVRLAEAGVIDANKFPDFYDEEFMTISPENSRVALNTLWALGLSNKNPILTEGPMMDPRYGGAENFASTGGWTLAKGDTMSHYGMHSFITLTPEQQDLVERMSKNIYRPCCGNSTYFPDCNHGMAMLGLLELMASQGAMEAQMYKTALEVNTLWFPDTYAAIKTLFASRGVDWSTVDPKEILGAEYSSASGYQRVLSQIEPQQQKGGPSCGV
ncbi:MAG: hypothetical protein UX71_C0001G0142 [Parcubacteria group bacterium GW2011_GWA1_47_10]|nr:MAG: hypothetical protein UX71_C0001G0142 [Parcubacteria group bacterium GW2011_GWA1_47_10]